MMFPKKNPLGKKKTKYNSSTQRCSLGHIHHSRGEAGYCNDLLLQMKCAPRIVKSFETQVKYPLKVNGKLIANHYVDFLVVLMDGKEEVHEYKGFATDVWNMKRKLFEAIYPKTPYKIIYHNPKRMKRF